MVKEYAIWGTKNGHEDIIRVNGQETQKSLGKAKQIVAVLEKRKEFQKLRIQTINMSEFDMKSSFIGTLKE